MLESFNTDKFEYKKLSLEEQKKRGILGRLVGIIADTKNPTRNGRKYSVDLWEKVFNDPIMKEKIENHIVLGELGHPEDREETDMEKVAISLAEQPKLGKDGKIYGVFDILDTRNGRLLKTLCDYGCNIGISSRGSGDVIYDDDGNEAVDPDTYVCECWDAVLVPGVEQARLQYVNEALDVKKRNKTLKQKLTEDLNKASDEDKKIMEETLKDLDINLNEKLVDPSEEDLARIESKFAELGLEVEGKGETMFGNKHYQLRKELDHKVTSGDLGPIFDALCDLDTPEMPTVCNVGVHRDGDNIISASLDVLKKSVDEQFYLHSSKVEDAKEKVKLAVDAEQLRDDLLKVADEDTVEKLIRKYISEDERKGLGAEILTPDEVEAKYGVRDLKDLKFEEELQDTDGWGEEIHDKLEPLFDEVERLMYEIRNGRRDSYANFGDTAQDLADKLNDLADQFGYMADEMEIQKDQLDEAIPTDYDKQRELMGKLVRINELSDEILSYDKEYDFNDEEDQLTIDHLNDTLDKLKDLCKKLGAVDEDCDNKEVNENAGDAGLVNQLQEALTKSAQLEKDNLSLQEQLSVCNAKEVKLEESLSKYKKAMVNLSNSSKENNELKESLDSLKTELESSKKDLNEKTKLLESTKVELENTKIRARKPRIDESLNTKVKGLEDKVTKLNEQLDESSKKLEKTTSIARQYKAALTEAKSLYVKAKAEACGISEADIRSKLKESYSIKDIDSICDELVVEKTSLSKLPFRINEGTKLGFKTSGDYINGGNFLDDDVISPSLLQMID